MKHYLILIFLGTFLCNIKAQEFPIKELPEDSATYFFKQIFYASQRVGNPKTDSLWEIYNNKIFSLNTKQKATEDYLRGHYFGRNELFDKASSYYIKSLKPSMKYHWKTLEVLNRTGMAINDYYLQNKDSALVRWKKILQNTPTELWYQRSVLHSNIGAVSFEKWLLEKESLTRKREFEKTLVYHYQQSIKLFKENNDKTSLCRLYGIYAMYYRELEKYDTAVHLLQKSTQIGLESKYPHQYHFTLINWGKLLNDQGKYPQAVDSLKKAITYYKENGPKAQLNHAISILARTYKLNGQSEDRAELLLEMIQLGKEMKIDKMTKQITLYRTHLEVYEKEREIKEQAQLIKEQRLENQLITVNQQRWIVSAIGTIIIIVLLSILWIFYIRNKNRHEKNELIIAERETALRSVIQAQEEERKRIAQELHDGIGQQLSGIKMALQNLQTQQKNSSESKLDEIIKIVTASSEEVRSLAHQMLPSILEKKGLNSAIEDLIQQIHKVTGIVFSFESGIESGKRYSTDAELAVYRSIQELINNSIKHANAQHIDLHIYELKGRLMSVYSDDGIGFDMESLQSGLGIKGIKSRIENLKGTFRIDTARGKGFSSTFSLPISS